MSMPTHFNQLLLLSSSPNNSDMSNTTSQLRIRTNTYPLKDMEIFVPEDDESVPYAVMLGMDKIRTAKGKKEKLLVGYFSALCAVLPNLTKLAYEILRNIGFEVEKVTVSEFCVYNRKKVRCFDKIIEDLSFAQLVYLPFAQNFKGIKNFWSSVARSAGIPLPIYVVRGSDVKTLHSALMLSGLIAQLRSEVYRAQQGFAALTRTPFGLIFNEASKCINVEVKLISSESITYDLNS